MTPMIGIRCSIICSMIQWVSSQLKAGCTPTSWKCQLNRPGCTEDQNCPV